MASNELAKPVGFGYIVIVDEGYELGTMSQGHIDGAISSKRNPPLRFFLETKLDRESRRNRLAYLAGDAIRAVSMTITSTVSGARSSNLMYTSESKSRSSKVGRLQVQTQIAILTLIPRHRSRDWRK